MQPYRVIFKVLYTCLMYTLLLRGFGVFFVCFLLLFFFSWNILFCTPSARTQLIKTFLQQHPGLLHKYIPCFLKNTLLYLLFFFNSITLVHLEILQGKWFHPYKSFIKIVCFFWGPISNDVSFQKVFDTLLHKCIHLMAHYVKCLALLNYDVCFFPVTCTAFPGEIRKVEGRRAALRCLNCMSYKESQ